MTTDNPTPLLIRPTQLAERLGVGRRTLYDWLRDPDPAHPIPRPLKIGRVTAWRTDEIEAWLDQLADRSRAA
ncbi:helix-turn-helix transcriptional regulator [Aliiroseovarius sp. KMU-71]|uniref:helix-turn-helix transcriptional regulator n=1 Tax=Aliiroseovarius sp. KMU-71 TaxID=3453123 RepID=UPI003F45FC4D